MASPILAKELVTEKELVSYLQEFKDLYKKACNKEINDLVPSGVSIIHLAPLKYPTLGVCRRNGISGFEIVISPSVIVSPSWDGQGRTTMRHELAHCLLNQSHINDPKHFMNPQLYEISHEELDKQTLEIMKDHCDDIYI